MPDHGTPPAPRPTGTVDIEIFGPAAGETCGEDCKFTLQVTVDSQMDAADIAAAADPALGPVQVPCWTAFEAAIPEGAGEVNNGITGAWLGAIDDDTVDLTSTYGGDDMDCNVTDHGGGRQSMVCTIEVPVSCGDADCNCGGGSDEAETVEFTVDVGDPAGAARGFTADVTMHATGDDGVCGIAEVTAEIDNIRHVRWPPAPLAEEEFNPADCSWGAGA